MAKRKATVNPIRTRGEEFLRVYAKALKEGWTREECADALGIKPESIYARCLATRKLRQCDPTSSSSKPQGKH